MSGRQCLIALTTLAVCLTASPSQQKAGAAKVEVHLAAEHAPEGLKAGSRTDLMYVTSSVKTKAGKVVHSTNVLVEGLEVVSVKREEKPADPAKAVVVELRGTKGQVEKVERAKRRTVVVAETEAGGKVVTKMRPLTLRLELAKKGKP
ncbi:MAG: hypothetical protein U0797_21085 [Gemmataceae bacterium]